MEVPVTFDFNQKKPSVYLGPPDGDNEKSIAAKVYMSEPDFHKILDKELGVNNAVLTRKIRIEGGLSGAQNANRLVSDLIKPYIIDTWNQATTEEKAQIQQKIDQ